MAMSDALNRELSRGQNLQHTSVFQPPSYNISHGPDKSLQWDPPADSDELAIALSYHFPIENTLKRKMQAAMEKFLQQAKLGRPACVKPIQDATPSKSGTVRQNPEAIPGLLSFDAKTLEEVKMKRRRRAYERSERAKVGSNRGNACELHRRQKLKCDPAKCRRNGQFKQSHLGQMDLPLHNLSLRSRGPHLSEERSLAPKDSGPSYQPDVIPKSSFLGPNPPNEPINALFSSNASHAAPGNVPGLTSFNPRFSPCETEAASSAEHASQFMGFEPDFSAFDDSFSFSLDRPLFLSHQSDTDTRYSWKPDEFLLSVLSHSMFA